MISECVKPAHTHNQINQNTITQMLNQLQSCKFVIMMWLTEAVVCLLAASLVRLHLYLYLSVQ